MTKVWRICWSVGGKRIWDIEGLSAASDWIPLILKVLITIYLLAGCDMDACVQVIVRVGRARGRWGRANCGCRFGDLGEEGVDGRREG